MIVLPSTSAWR